MVGTDPFTRVSVSYWPTLLKQSDVRWLAQTNTNRSQHVVKNETQPLSLSDVDFYNQQQSCLPVYLWVTTLWNSAVSPQDTPNTSGMNASSQISPVTAQRRSAYDNDSFSYVTTGADSDQPVGAPCYQWLGCRDAGITCFPDSGSWQAQGGPAYICRDQRKCVFHDMGPLRWRRVSLKMFWMFHTTFPSYYIWDSSFTPQTHCFIQHAFRRHFWSSCLYQWVSVWSGTD